MIAAREALTTAFALLANFYLRFEESELSTHLPISPRLQPFFVVFRVIMWRVVKPTTKWRFISPPNTLNILRVVTILAVVLIVLDHALIARRRTISCRSCSDT